MADSDAIIRATEMDVTMIGLQNAGKTSLLRVLSVGVLCNSSKHFLIA
jgi:ABC-type phosphate/phosphonate transport system ATPase subunit